MNLICLYRVNVKTVEPVHKRIVVQLATVLPHGDTFPPFKFKSFLHNASLVEHFEMTQEFKFYNGENLNKFIILKRCLHLKSSKNECELQQQFESNRFSRFDNNGYAIKIKIK